MNDVQWTTFAVAMFCGVVLVSQALLLVLVGPPRSFSLRTLLIAMTLVAVVLGLIVYASK